MLTKEQIKQFLNNTFSDEDFEQYWPDLVELSVMAELFAAELFTDGLPNMKEFIRGRKDLVAYGNDLVKLGAAEAVHRGPNPNVRLLFDWGLCATKQAFGDRFEYYWPDLVNLGVAAKGGDVRSLFEHGFPCMREFIHNRLDLIVIGHDLVRLTLDSDRYAFDLLNHLLPHLKELFGKELGNYLPDIVALEQEGKEPGYSFTGPRDLLFDRLREVKKLIRNREDLRRIGQELLESGKGPRPRSPE